jgi:hypothetical protein
MFVNRNMEPLTRQYLLGLKAQVDEETRVRNVQSYVSQICSNVKQIATTTPQTRFQQKVAPVNGNPSSGYLHMGHGMPLNGIFNVRHSMPDILDKLRGVFPDSKVEFKSLSRGQDGKMYDIADIDERMKPFINPQLNEDFIIVDWS